jgi:hypothetical protein
MSEGVGGLDHVYNVLILIQETCVESLNNDHFAAAA